MMKFSNDWFKPHIDTWNLVLQHYNPARVLEIGSYEGQSICHLIQVMSSKHALEIYCLDTWMGGREHTELGTDMSEVERTFDENIRECVQYAPPPRVFPSTW